jgi:hypothetical protein
VLPYGAIFVMGKVRGRLGRKQQSQAHGDGTGKIHRFDSSVKHGGPSLNAWQIFSESIGRSPAGYPSSLAIRGTTQAPAGS